MGPRDFLTDGAQTFPYAFVKVQGQLNNYQQHLDRRLSIPKHQRLRDPANFEPKRTEMVAGGVLRAQSKGTPGISGSLGAFNNRSSWVPNRTSKSVGKRNFMIAKS